MAIKISGTTIINDSRAILDHTSNVGTAGSMLVSTGSGICWKSAPSAGFSPDAQGNLYAGTNAGANSDADTCFNIALGKEAGNALNEGDGNVFLGKYAGHLSAVISNNVFLGTNSGKCINHASAVNNIVIGNDAMMGGSTAANNSGDVNVAIGRAALKVNVTGANNVAIGFEAGNKNDSGNSSVFIGKNAGHEDDDGGYHVFLGNEAGMCMQGDSNIAIGREAGKGSSTPADNTGTDNISIGMYAGISLTSGTQNVLLGRNVGCNVTSGGCNVFIGNHAGNFVTSGNYHVFIGCAAGQNMRGLSNIGIGFEAGKGGATPADNDGKKNTSVGYQAGAGLTSGGYNAFYGCGAGNKVTTGHYNTAIGDESLFATNTGSGQVAIGYKALCEATSAPYTVAVGPMAGKEVTTSCESVFIGYYSAGAGAANITGHKHVIIGNRAGLVIEGASNKNTFLGNYAGCNVTTGSCNVMIGHKAIAASATGHTQLTIGIGATSWIVGDNNFNVEFNTVTKAGGSFKIDHPHPTKTATHHLVHSFIEGPQQDLIYRGRATLVNGVATINIDTSAGMTDGTFVLLNRDIQSFTTNETGWDAVKSSVSGNILTITSQDNSSTATISWMVIGERQDDTAKKLGITDDDGYLIVEPPKEVNFN